MCHVGLGEGRALGLEYARGSMLTSLGGEWVPGFVGVSVNSNSPFWCPCMLGSPFPESPMS